MTSNRIRPWWSDSTETVSGIPGAIHSGAEERRQAPPNLTFRVMPPSGGFQFTTNPPMAVYGSGGLMFGNAIGFSGSLRLIDLVELEFGYQLGGQRCGDFSDASRQTTVRLGLAPRIWSTRVSSLRVPVLAGLSEMNVIGHCEEEKSGHVSSTTVASGLDLNVGAFDVRLLANGGWAAAQLEDYGALIYHHEDAFTYRRKP